MRRYAEALAALERVEQTLPLVPEDLTNKAEALRALGRTAEAEDVMRQAQELGG